MEELIATGLLELPEVQQLFRQVTEMHPRAKPGEIERHFENAILHSEWISEPAGLNGVVGRA